MKRLRLWIADGGAPPENSVLLLLPDPALAAAAAPLVAELAGSGRRLSVVVALPRGAAPGLAAKALPGAILRCPRVPPGLPARVALAAVRTRVVLLAGDRRALSGSLARLMRGARARGLPIAEFGLGTLSGLAAGGRERLGFNGVARPDPAELDIRATAALLIGAMGLERGQGRLLDALSGHVAGVLRGPRRRAVPLLARIDDLEALRRRLGAPETILCLGNGPTSADPALSGMARDALFRVNHQWMRRRFLDRPDLIFPGVKRSMRAAGRTPMVVATTAKERALIAARLFAPWHGPATYAVAEEIAGAVMRPVPGPFRPTMGAYMIAVAVALSPRRLIVAGLDMFSHPAGAYPAGGAPEESGANAYAPSHDLETDAAFIRDCLAAYQGEIETLSPAFAALARSVPDRRFRLCATPGETGEG